MTYDTTNLLVLRRTSDLHSATSKEL